MCVIYFLLPVPAHCDQIARHSLVKPLSVLEPIIPTSNISQRFALLCSSELEDFLSVRSQMTSLQVIDRSSIGRAVLSHTRIGFLWSSQQVRTANAMYWSVDFSSTIAMSIMDAEGVAHVVDSFTILS